MGILDIRRTSIGSEFAVVVGEVVLWDGVVCQNSRERAQAKDDDGPQHLVGSKKNFLAELLVY